MLERRCSECSVALRLRSVSQLGADYVVNYSKQKLKDAAASSPSHCSGSCRAM